MYIDFYKVIPSEVFLIVHDILGLNATDIRALFINGADEVFCMKVSACAIATVKPLSVF